MLTANASFGDETLAASEVKNWQLMGEYSEGTTLTDNGNGTAILYVSSDETELITVCADYEYDNETHSAEIVIPNHPPVRSMGLYTSDGEYNKVSYEPGTEAEIVLTAYAFPNYTGSVQPTEDAYAGNEAALIASHLSFYLGESDENGSPYDLTDVVGVDLVQDNFDKNKVKVIIGETATESFSVVCHLDSGFLCYFSIKAE